MITGGGTGGHVYPALALADALVARGHPRDTIRFVGARRGLEARVVPEAGYAIDLLPGRGLQRRLTTANVRAGWDTLKAFARVRDGVRRCHADDVEALRAGSRRQGGLERRGIFQKSRSA